MNTENITKFAEIVKNSHKIVFFGGAGVSTEIAPKGTTNVCVNV